MSSPFEIIPPSNEQHQFPRGDISPSARDSAVATLYKLAAGDLEQQSWEMRLTRQQQVGSWRNMPGQEANHLALLKLAEGWGASYSGSSEVGKMIADASIFNTLAFVVRCRMLPPRFNDFSDTLAEMSTRGSDYITFMGTEAWELMQTTHPHVHEVLGSFAAHAASLIGIISYQTAEKDGAARLFQAGAALPYLLASTTSMENNLGTPFGNEVAFPNVPGGKGFMLLLPEAIDKLPKLPPITGQP